MSIPKNLSEILDLLLVLQNSYCGKTYQELQEIYGYSRRKLERMMSVLTEQFGDKIEVVDNLYDRKKHFRLKKGSMNSLISFSDLELSKMQNLINSVSEEAEKKSLQEILEKIKALNPKKYNKNDIDVLLEAQGFAVRQYRTENIDINVMNQIANAIQSVQKIKTFYCDSSGNSGDVILEPYGLKIADNHYLIAKHNNKIKTFKISRMKNVRILENCYFDRDESFNIQEYCNKSFGIYTEEEVKEFVLQFHPSIKDDVLNYNFHPTQSFEIQKDESIIVKFYASGEWEITTELLKWRDKVKILAPQSLKDNYINEVKAMYKNIQEDLGKK